MSFLHYVVSSTPPVLAHVLTVTAHAWGLSDQPPVPRDRVSPPLHALGLRWAV
jgi:hypothetical protein